jgi:DNA-binding transcriptional MerR regulator
VEDTIKLYRIGQLVRMAGVSVRTLHHYDRVGLLRPAGRSEAGYRLYGEAELLRLQQALFYRELDLPLEAIRRILDDPAFEQVAALEQHRSLLQGRSERLARLVRTIDRTITRLTEDEMALTDEELYEVFGPEEIERIKRETRERYDPKLVGEANRRVSQMSREAWQALQAEGGAVTVELAALMGRDPADPAVQALVARHHAWIERFYPCSADVYRGLGQGYAGDPAFRAFYERVRAGLADFLCLAMAHYAEYVLAHRA